MYIAIGDPYSNDQSVRMVHAPSICLGEDNVFELSLCVLCWTLLSRKHMYLGRGFHFFRILVTCIVAFLDYIWSTNYGQHFLYPFWTLLSRSLLFVSSLGLVQKIFEVPNPYESFDLIFEGHASLSTVPYVFVEDTIFLDISL